MSSYKPRRSVLFMPGSNPRALAKIPDLHADCIIVDLEDAVLPEQLAGARENIRATLGQEHYPGSEVLVRVNGIDTSECERDLKAIADLAMDGVVFPKVGSVAEMKRILEVLDAVGIDANASIWIMIETPAGLLDMRGILVAGSRVDAVMIGTADLAKTMRLPATPGRLGLLSYLSHCVLVARAAGVDIIDGIHQDFHDLRGLEKACEQGRNLGFDGKSLIHPGQIETANRLFMASEQELRDARELISAWETGEKLNSGIVVHKGRMIEHLHVETARDMVQRAETIEANQALRQP